MKSKEQSGEADTARAVQTLRAIWRNVKSTPGSAREARTQFETGFGDALITYELEGLLMKEGKKTPLEIVVPQATIFSEHPAVIIDRNVAAGNRPAVNAIIEYLSSEEAQRTFVRYHFRSASNETLNQDNPQLATIEMPFGIDFFGGWQRAYPEIIEKIFRDQVQRK